MSLVKWVDGYYDNKADVPLEKIGDGKDLEFVPLAVVPLVDLVNLVEELRDGYTGDFSAYRWALNDLLAKLEAQRLLARLEGAK